MKSNRYKNSFIGTTHWETPAGTAPPRVVFAPTGGISGRNVVIQAGRPLVYRSGTAVWCTTTRERGYGLSESKLCCWFQNHLLMFRGSRHAWFCSAVRVLTLSWKLKRIVPCKAHRGSVIVSVPSFLYQLALPPQFSDLLCLKSCDT